MCAFIHIQLTPRVLQQAGHRQNMHTVSVAASVWTCLLCLPSALKGRNLLNETDGGVRGERL